MSMSMSTPATSTDEVVSTLHSTLSTINHTIFNTGRSAADITSLILSYAYDYIPPVIDDTESTGYAISSLLYQLCYIPHLLQTLEQYCNTHPYDEIPCPIAAASSNNNSSDKRKSIIMAMV